VKVFLDTNVLVSGFATRGLCADVIRLVLAEHEFVTAEVTLEELQQVLIQKIRLPRDMVEEILSYLRSHPVQPRPATASPARIRDDDDRWALASALAALADILVTGDKDLLDASERVSEILITSPRGFWNRARKPRKK
jgi:putative PIN family toxin of toxin-antitoxin system